MRRLAPFLAIALATAGVGAAHAHLGAHEVSVRDNYYDPQVLEIDRGEAVTWTAVNGGHTVTADDGSFDLPAGTTLGAGESARWTAPERDVTIRYRCRVHASMVGVIEVGTGSVIEPPPPPPVETRNVPSLLFPTLAAATVNMPANLRIEVAPGTYRESIILNAPHLTGLQPNITLIGTGPESSSVTFDGEGIHSIGIGVLVNGVHLENLTVRGYRSAGVLVRDVTDFSIEHVQAIGNAAYGIRTLGAARGSIRTVTSEGSARAGIAIHGCDLCDIVVESVRSSGNLAGLATLDAGAVVVRRSVFTGNAVGIALKASTEATAGPRGATHIVGNSITNSRAHTFPGDPATLELAAHAGIWVDGARFVTVASNEVRDARWGALVTGLHGASFENRIAGNRFASIDDADLAWDGLGAMTCFAGNTSQDVDTPVRTQPPALQDLYPCDRATVGVPYPFVDALLLAGTL